MGLAPGKDYINSPVRVGIHFENSDGDDIDPTTVGFKTKSPSGIETTYVYGTDSEIAQIDTGDFYAEVTPDEAGRWFYRWYTTGTNKTIAQEGNFLIQDSPFFDSWPVDYS
jgi:hypothetical protein